MISEWGLNKMSDRKEKRKQISNRHILSLHSDGLSVNEISRLTLKSKLHVKNTIARCITLEPNQ